MVKGEDLKNDKLEKFKLNFSRCSNCDVAPLKLSLETRHIDLALRVRSDTK